MGRQGGRNWRCCAPAALRAARIPHFADHVSMPE
jgi:hypothetical protein